MTYASSLPRLSRLAPRGAREEDAVLRGGASWHRRLVPGPIVTSSGLPGRYALEKTLTSPQEANRPSECVDRGYRLADDFPCCDFQLRGDGDFRRGCDARYAPPTELHGTKARQDCKLEWVEFYWPLYHVSHPHRKALVRAWPERPGAQKSRSTDDTPNVPEAVRDRAAAWTLYRSRS